MNLRTEKLLIINADDFGLTEGINQAIVRAFNEGVVRSASIMPVGKAYNDAVKLIYENPGIDIGIHLCLTEEKSILTKKDIPSLVGEDGYFLKTHPEFILNYLLRKVRLIDIERELNAQIKKVFEAGIRATHIDSHSYIHMWPSIFKIVIRLAKKYNILFIRYPYERSINLNANLFRYISKVSLNVLCSFSKKSYRNGFPLRTKYFYGFLNSGHLSERYLIDILKRVDRGVTEIVCHPGICNEGMRCYIYWGYKWEEELRFLTSSNIKERIKGLNIKLVSFRGIL